MRLRQARLKTRYWSYYPTVQSGIWHGAAALVGRVLYDHRGRPTFASLVDRPLPEEHFDFRYGDPRRGPGEAKPLSRCNDPIPVYRQAEHRSDSTGRPPRVAG